MGKRDDIVRAALAVLERRGFAGTRVEDICREAGIAKGTYYLYFKTREDVAEAIFEGVIAQYRARAEALGTLEYVESSTDNAGPANGGVRAVCEEIRALFSEAQGRISLIPTLFTILGELMVAGNAGLADRLGAAFSGLAEAWAPLLSRAGVPDAAIVARTIVSMVDGVILHAALFSGPGTDLNEACGAICTLVKSQATIGGMR